MDDIVLVSGARTPIGTFGKSLAPLRARQLGAAVVRAALERAGLGPDVVDEVIMGCVAQVGEDSYIARTSALDAGLPDRVTALSVNRLCSSGLQAIVSAAQGIQTGAIRVAVAGGTESMSNVPYLLPGARSGLRMGHQTVQDGMLVVLTDPFQRVHMGITAENVAARFHVSRREQDELALESQRRAGAAHQASRFVDEILPMTLRGPRGEETTVAADEHPRPTTTLDQLSAMRPAFQVDGSVTAGNSSGINDGAAAVVVTTAAAARDLGLTPRLYYRGMAVAGVEPGVMGIGPVPAIKRLLAQTGMSAGDIDVWELNEAFAAQAAAVLRELDLPSERVNPNGGAIALGHPVGATGAILTVKLMYELARSRKRYGVVSMCIGGGQGMAALFERA